MSKRSAHLAVRALPGLAADLRAYKRRAVRAARERACQATPGSAMRRALWARLERLRAMTPAEMRGWYQSETVQRVTREPRIALLRRVCRGRVVEVLA
jgi:hypothetical protein